MQGVLAHSLAFSLPGPGPLSQPQDASLIDNVPFIDMKEIATQAGKIGYPIIDRDTAPSSCLVAAWKSLEKLTKKLNTTLAEIPAESEGKKASEEKSEGKKTSAGQTLPLDALIGTP